MKVTRADQLSMKPSKNDGGEPGRGRGRGRGRGKGQGRGKAKGTTNDSAPDKPETPTPETEPSTTKPPPKKKAKVAECDGCDWEEDWNNHWVEEWGVSWDHQSWGNEQKAWDEYAWWDGYESLSKISKKKPKKVVMREETGGSAKPEPSASNPGKKVKKITKQKANGSQKTGPKRKAKGDTTHEDDGHCTKHKKTSASGSKATASKPQTEATEEIAKEEGDTYDPLPKRKRKSIKKALVNFGMNFFGMEDVDKEDLKMRIKERLKSLTHCRLNLYWSRRASGVHVKPWGHDTGYLPLRPADVDGLDQLQWPVVWAVSAKYAELFVPRLNCCSI